MVPEFDVKQIDTRLSSDVPSHIYTWFILATIIGFFVLRGGFETADIFKFGVIMALVGLQSLTHFLPVVKNWKAFHSGGIGALLIYNISLALLFVWFLPLFSPFLLIIPAVMFITIYYRGVMSFFISLASLVVVVIVISLKGVTVDAEALHYYPYLIIILGAAYGGIIQRASAIDAEVRNEFNRVSLKIGQERQQLSSLINSMSDAVLAVDTQGIVLFYNAGAANLLDTNLNLVGKQITTYLKIHNKADQIVDTLGLVSGKSSYTSRDLHLVTHDKEKISLAVDMTPIRSNYNQWQQQGYIILLRDITKEKTLDQERDEFIAVTSHELRTPIAIAEANISTALIAEPLKSLEGGPKQQLEQAYSTILELSNLVNDLALLTQAEQAGVATSGELIDDPVEFLQQIVHEFAKKAAAKSLALHVMGPEVLPGLVTKKFYLGKILEGFISNAIKYTSEGSVIVSATQAQDTGIIFSVKDTGMGIEQSDKDKIFKKFYRSEDYRIRQTSGTGLGLYIASKLATNIHGKIWLESKLGEGSTFYLHAPSINLPEKSKPHTGSKPATKEHHMPVTAKVTDT